MTGADDDDRRNYQPSGEDLRDEGITLVLTNERAETQRWIEEQLRKLPKGWQGLFEAARLEIITHPNYPGVHHPNVWGAIANNVIRRGWFEKTNRLATPRDRRSHASGKSVLVKIV